MDPRHFLALAETLLREVTATPDPALDGAKCRTALNRAYSAAFLVACEPFGAMNLNVPSGSKCHSVVQAGLNNSGVTPLVKISERLGTLDTGRADAGYDMRARHTESAPQVAVNVALARTPIAMLDAIRTGRANPPVHFTVVADTMPAWALQAGQPLGRKWSDFAWSTVAISSPRAP